MYAIRRHFKILMNYSLNQSFSPIKYLYSSTCYPNYHFNNHIFNSFHSFTSESNNKSINNTNSSTDNKCDNTTTSSSTNTHNNNNNLECIESNIKNDRYIAVFTCNICNNRTAKSFSKQAYHHGIVYVKCESCNSRKLLLIIIHLISDQLGWFGEKQNIEEILLKKGQEVSKMELGENVSDSDLQLIQSLKHNKYFKQ
ncbi:uncharacterized protein TA20720 [Theileria annulata]|uniref:DNL-type domain-containing protein n=1 Tax=Theileria annulata TaxID=5874 RepID=Q4UH13_THEAN|nr:uncharacterized protein TA20720 [Theileria annulata]CAI73626.1 hypothetical protein TA20720 [Theileria annulata]|eukprot:XP_954303.1 hypothetical protein TA20720 [Theileria annulata]